MFAPGAASLMQEFHQTSATLGTLVVPMYFLGFVLGPLAIAPLSELHGRLYICHASNVIFLGTTIGCALSTNVVMFLAFRFLAGFTGSAPLVHGGGTVADAMPREKRGVVTAIFAAGCLLGPLIGPSMGVSISSRAGWRWTFWVLSIFVST